ncbi:MAG: hypothetical protein KAH13_00445, partial [Tenericutes bacterium]|nr:hypothetical protein [Mycoplasmatota bacterium]
ILWFSLLKKDRKANQLFKINTILAIMFYIWVIISFVVLATDPSLPKFTLGFGFYLATISITGLILLAWKQELLMNFIYKVFKVPEIQEVEYVEKEIPAEEPKEVEKPVIAKEPVPTPEPEPTLEPVVEAPKEEKVEEPTPASKPIAKDQI